MWSEDHPLSSHPPVERLREWLKENDSVAVSRYIEGRPIEWYWGDVADFIMLTGCVNVVQKQVLLELCAAGGVYVNIYNKDSIDGLYRQIRLRGYS